MEIKTIKAGKERCFTHDPKGFFLIWVDKEKGRIVVEHYQNVHKDAAGVKIATGKLDCVITGTEAEAIADTVITEELITRQDHAAYLGIELEKAEIALKQGLEYEQDAFLKF